MKTTVLILTGLVGCGKTTASDFFHKKKIPVFRMGELTDFFLKKSDITQTPFSEKKARNQLRKIYGEEIYAKNTADKILKKKQGKIIIIEGMKSCRELEYFKKKFIEIKVLFIESDKELRYQRLILRCKRPLMRSEAIERENEEINQFSLDKLKEIADFVVDNNGSIDEFDDKLNNILMVLTQSVIARSIATKQSLV